MDMKSIGARIKSRRKQRNLTIKELAAKASVSHALIARLENGSAGDARISTLNKLAVALECPPESLVSNGERSYQPGGSSSADVIETWLTEFIFGIQKLKQYGLNTRLANTVIRGAGRILLSPVLGRAFQLSESAAPLPFEKWCEAVLSGAIAPNALLEIQDMGAKRYNDLLAAIRRYQGARSGNADGR